MFTLFSNIQTQAFVYIWEDSLTGKFYIGSHKGTPDDGYVASSESFMEEYNERPEDFKRVIVAVCETYGQARHQEALLCKAVDAKNNERYYNGHNGDGKFYHETLTEEHKQKISKGLISFYENAPPMAKESREKLSLGAYETGFNNWNKGKKFSKEHKRKISKSRKGIKASEETKEKLRKAWKTRLPISDETKKKIADSHRGKKRSPEVGKRISAALKGKTLSEEHKRKLSLAKKGKTLSEEHKKKIAISVKRAKST